MKVKEKIYPIFDLHCDLLQYLEKYNHADPCNKEDIGCAVPYLQEGNVRFQVMAIYASTKKRSVVSAGRQASIFQELPTMSGGIFKNVCSPEVFNQICETDQIGIVAAIENASCVCEEDEKLTSVFDRLDGLTELLGRILYISLTHHGENRFGGGNQSKTGLKDDGRSLLDFLHEKSIAVDLSHASDALATDILDYIIKKELNVAVLASHSNFRMSCDHPRNLSDEIAKEIIRQKGLIGINFIRAFIDPDHPEKLEAHIQHGLELGGDRSLCFGADFFYWKGYSHPDHYPIFFEVHENAGKYQNILNSVSLSPDDKSALAYSNAEAFLKRIWR